MRKPFFPVHRFLQQRGGVIPPVRRRGRCEWVVARSLSHYHCFDLHKIPPARRDATLELRIRQWSPFREHATYSVWHKGYAQVWLWDGAAQEEARLAAGVKHAGVVPESLLRPPAADGLQILPCLEGVEARLWRQGVLHASRWWAQPPSPQEWNYFLRAHQLPLDTALEVEAEAPLLPRAWGRRRRAMGWLGGLRNERAWAGIGAALLLTVLTWQGMGVWKQHQALGKVQNEIDSLSARAAPILQARNQAVNERAAVAGLLALKPYPAHLLILAAVAEQLPDSEARLTEWLYDAGALRFTIHAQNIDPRIYVQRFQDHPMFTEVKSETGRQPDQIVMHMRVEISSGLGATENG